MSKLRVLITGGSGLLALNWACAVRGEWDVILGTHLHGVTLAGVAFHQLALDDGLQFERQLDQFAPDLIVHAAGLSNVDRCESDPAFARKANAEIARNVALAAARKNIRLIHISTDHLFSGRSSFYSEDALPQPLNEYGRSKLLAEELVQQDCPQALIVRTNFFGWGSAQRQSFSDWVIYNLRAGKPLSLFDDVYVSPILADSLALAAHELSGRGVAGIINLAGDERVSKYQFALQLAECFSLPVELIRRDQLAHAKLQARRPRDMSLDNSKAKSLLGRRLGSLNDYLLELRSQEVHGRRSELFHAVSEIS